MVDQACYPSYLGGADQEDHGVRSAYANSKQDLISINKLGVVVCTCGPSYTGGIDRRTEV
jgi:hypothetical protein